jgi:hypothetical protein
MGGGNWSPSGDRSPPVFIYWRVFRGGEGTLSVLQIDKATPRVIGGRPLAKEAEGKPRVQRRNEIGGWENGEFLLCLSQI